MPFSYEDWEKEFAPKLKNTRRWDGFSYLAKSLAEKEVINLLEIGCIRVAGSWEADGQSTQIWDWIARRTKGKFVSIEKEEKHAEIARSLCPNVSFIVGDGMSKISSMNLYNLDVLFLDAMDFTGPHAFNSWIQHIGFLAAAWSQLKSGALIVVDDCTDNNEGKHVMIKDFFRRMGNKPLVESYVHIWRMT